MTKKMIKLLLIDGNNLAHRARHRFVKFSFQGRSSSVAYGGPFIISSLIRRFPNDGTFVIFDGGRAKERMALLPDYKQRDKHDVDDYFEQQLDDFQKILMNLNVHTVRKIGEEADDYIYNLCRNNRKTHKTIVSSDKDFIPHLGPYTKIFNPFKDKIITTENCRAVYGFTHKEFLDYLILKGDKSDNIPGVRGLGDVRIAALIEQYGDIDNYLDTCNSGEFEKYWDEIDEAYDRNMELISLRYFHNKYRRKSGIPIKYGTLNLPAVEAITRKYGITAFRKDSFLKPFKGLG